MNGWPVLTKAANKSLRIAENYFARKIANVLSIAIEKLVLPHIKYNEEAIEQESEARPRKLQADALSQLSDDLDVA